MLYSVLVALTVLQCSVQVNLQVSCVLYATRFKTILPGSAHAVWKRQILFLRDDNESCSLPWGFSADWGDHLSVKTGFMSVYYFILPNRNSSKLRNISGPLALFGHAIHHSYHFDVNKVVAVRFVDRFPIFSVHLWTEAYVCKIIVWNKKKGQFFMPCGNLWSST